MRGRLRWMGIAWMGIGCTGAPATPEGHVDVEIPFEARVSGEPFACGTSFPGIGIGAVAVEALDFRLYVHDVALLDADGEPVPLELEQDGRWQYEDVALLDFEDGTASCATGSPEMRTVVVGRVPEGEYHGLRFRVGVPVELNHLDAAVAPAPLNDPGLWWAWTSGFKYARIDVKTEQNPSFFLHLGATNCSRDDAGEYGCELDNVPLVSLPDFHGDGTVVLDLAALYADSDLDAQPDYVTDFVSGCMAFEGDPECHTLMPKMGLGWEGTEAGEQVLFQVEAR
jgi:uncharacterized repeat protein (TIGR04052 family)